MPDQKQDIESELRRDLGRRIDQLKKMYKSGIPDCALAPAVELVWQTALVLFPEEMLRARMHHELEHARNRSAICAKCGVRRIECAKSHPVWCGECEARLDAEMAEIDRKYGDASEFGETI